MEQKIAHLGFIQTVITRMGGNAFLIKGWTVALVAAIFALSAKDSNSNFIFIAIFPIFVFWALDSYYLRQERLYRKLYEKVADDTIKSEKFTMNATQFDNEVQSLFRVALSKSIFPFYLLILLILFVSAIKVESGFSFHGSLSQICSTLS
ncbi:hypothetical protein MJS38_34195, partial [Burkholderia gladioli]|uniref:hypothetical protein n=1 Tax=Burkholderia gladioli TaxID=28095 RepID=UPI000F51BBDD|nr:hypothetical protein [Burkholderia gladioli]MBU9159710.1 hypothetical protein [Burkholderia gladioli]MCH7270730.1 hypothetical protein [Burkholderia gladioli]MDR8090074.1 hypothetical protein [Burkholderia gladioli]MEB2550022.1 hypothetical protein [Burkholderia gladioli]